MCMNLWVWQDHTRKWSKDENENFILKNPCLIYVFTIKYYVADFSEFVQCKHKLNKTGAGDEEEKSVQMYALPPPPKSWPSTPSLYIFLN